MDLYALPPEEFIEARDAAAKQDKTVKALRKPTVSAWVVNTLVRRDPRLLDELLALGASLAEAQRAGQGDVLRQLGEQRRQLVQAVTARALELTERDVTAGVRSEVEATLEAALADPPSAAAVHTGELVRSLSFAGFGGVDLEGAVAEVSGLRPGNAPRARSGPRGARAPREADNSQKAAALEAAALEAAALESAALEAAGALDDAVQAADAAVRAIACAQKQLADALTHEQQAAARVTEAKAALDAAEKERGAARKRRADLERDAAALGRRSIAATKQVDTAQQKSDRKRQELDALRRG